MSKLLSNHKRNTEVEEAIGKLKASDLGDQSKKHAAIASALGSLNLSESIQLLQLQTEESSRASRVTLEKVIDKLVTSNKVLARSNEKYANRMVWLTAALVFVACIQAAVGYMQYRASQDIVKTRNQISTPIIDQTHIK